MSASSKPLDHASLEDPECLVYLISPPKLDLRTFYGQLDEALGAGIVACLQLRMKDVSDDVVLGAAETLMPLMEKYDTTLLINDRPDIAKQIGADGVHIGQDDTSYEEARSILGDDAVIGVTCHDSKHLAMVAGEKGADYVAFGAFHPTTTKETEFQADLDLIRWWRDATTVQSCAIGGITVDNCAPIISAGADFIAISSGVWDYPKGPGAAVKEFNRIITKTPLEDPII